MSDTHNLSNLIRTGHKLHIALQRHRVPDRVGCALLTKTERLILCQLIHGHTAEAIARGLKLCLLSVEAYLLSARHKLGGVSMLHTCVCAMACGIG